MSQATRVLAALQRAGSYGITSIDFDAPNVCDGGKPIRRVAARVKDLRDAGFDVQTDGERHGCAVYRLVRDRDGRPADPAGDGRLFAMPAQPAGASHWRVS